jgi:hypothetical protein
MRGNPIRRLGDRPSAHFTQVPNAIVRDGTIGSDAFRVLVLLLSHADGWTTSAGEISKRFGWGRNREKASAALDNLVAERRLIIREHRRDGGGRVRQEYIVNADGAQFTEEDIEKWSVPLIVNGGRGSHGKRKQP